MAAPYLFTDPTARPLDANGAPMPGGYMQFYASGTTSPADVYTDAELTTPHENRVVADAAGRFAVIYLDPAVTYRVQLYDADDVLIYDVDPYAPPRDAPPGTVVFFHGTEEARDIAYPPSLWQVLDGNNGTPDGRDRFIVLAGGSLESGGTGGSGAAAQTSAAGGHSHGGNTGGHSLAIEQMPEHAHGGYYNTGFERNMTQSAPAGSQRSGVVIPGATRNDPGNLDTIGNSATAAGLTTEAGEGDPHTHSIAAEEAHTHMVSVTPPYVALWALMRRAPD